MLCSPAPWAQPLHCPAWASVGISLCLPRVLQFPNCSHDSGWLGLPPALGSSAVLHGLLPRGWWPWLDFQGDSDMTTSIEGSPELGACASHHYGIQCAFHLCSHHISTMITPEHRHHRFLICPHMCVHTHTLTHAHSSQTPHEQEIGPLRLYVPHFWHITGESMCMWINEQINILTDT